MSDVAWVHNVDPPVPLVTEVYEAEDGHNSIRVHGKDESLRRFQAALAEKEARVVKLEGQVGALVETLEWVLAVVARGGLPNLARARAVLASVKDSGDG